MQPQSKHINHQHKQSKKYMRNIIKHTPLLLNTNKPSNIYTQEIIIHPTLIPLQIQLINTAKTPLTLTINDQYITIKQQALTFTHAYHLSQETWTKIDFQESMNIVDIKPQHIVNLSLNSLIYYSTSQWKFSATKTSNKPSILSLKSILQALYRKNTQNIDHHPINYQGNRPSTLKQRFTQRTRSYTIRHKITSLKSKQESFCQRDINSRQQTSSLSKNRTNASTTLSNEPLKIQKHTTKKRISNIKITQNQNQQHLVFSKKHINLRDRPQIRLRQNSPLFQDSEYQCKAKNRGKVRPKFYEQIPLTHQQIELKRKRFDSQFIPIKSQICSSQFPNALETEQSQVTEEICKEQHLDNKFQDTFERGMEPLKPNPNNEQSGTLCQSVFE